jgi:hypothetical protein
MRKLGRCVAVAVTGALCAFGISGLAQGAGTTPPKTVKITVRAIGRDGSPAQVGNGAVAVSLSANTPQSSYRASLAGVLSVPPGKYLIGVDIAVSDNSTFAARAITARRNETIRFDARRGVPIKLSIDVGSQAELAYADLCYSAGGSSAADFISDGRDVTNGQTNLYAIPYSYPGLSLGYAGDWFPAGGWVHGRQYLASGATSGGIPAKPDFSFQVAKLARLTLQTKSGTTAGDQSRWMIEQMGCPPALYWLPDSTRVPSQRTLHVSAGQWLIKSFPSDGTGQSLSQLTVGLRASEKHVQTIDGAVVGPASGFLPGYVPRDVPGHSPKQRNELGLWLGEDLFSDSDGGYNCCANAIVDLRSGGKVIRSETFTDAVVSEFLARLPRLGWYGLTVDASRAAPPTGISPAVLTPRVTISWRFRVAAADLTTNTGNFPVSAATFTGGGLDMNNNAAPDAVTALQMRVSRGRLGRAYRLKTVRLQLSVDDGKTWQPVALTARRGYWLAEIPDPRSGFVSLRSTVTDFRGDTSVQTIYRAYGIS